MCIRDRQGLILLGVTEALQAAKLRFPDQIALAGFDDLPWTRLVEPGITVVSQPVYDIGRAAIELLLQRIASNRVTSWRMSGCGRERSFKMYSAHVAHGVASNRCRS